MHTSIDRKGYSRGETIPVYISVDNQTKAKVTPQILLRQVQIFMSAQAHKTVNNMVSGKEPIRGKDVEPNSKMDQTIELKIPECESLSIKSSIITVKYFVDVILTIPQSFDLKIELPVVLSKQSELSA